MEVADGPVTGTKSEYLRVDVRSIHRQGLLQPEPPLGR